MERAVFIKRTARYLLLVVLAATAVFLGRRAVSGNACSTCAGNGICRGETDCRSYLNTTENGS